MAVDCPNLVENNWPLAYADCGQQIIVPLENHLRDVAETIVCLFRDRLEVLKSALGNKLPEALDPLELAYCAGVLHDLGKASWHYLKEFKKNYRWRGKKELTFPFHEHVVGVVLEWLAQQESEEPLKAYYDLLAKVVSRHHAAQPGR
ncbi:HD domain-containing protein, partial [Infirmifilum sp.]|uniref:HD domain-containing protein n=1 Tax=Infirmifilum sp. TaxID=2856575 RepID=UPI003D0CC520